MNGTPPDGSELSRHLTLKSYIMTGPNIGRRVPWETMRGDLCTAALYRINKALMNVQQNA